MKKVSTLLLSIIICITFFGCNTDTSEVQETQSTAVLSTVKEETTSEIKGASTIKATDTTQSSESDETKSDSNQSSKGSYTRPKYSPETKTTTASRSSEKPTEKKTSKPSITKKVTTTKNQTTTSSTITCTVTVECKSILNNMDKLKEGHEAYVPSGGYFINGCTVTLNNGSSAYDAVQIACNQKGIHMNTVNSGYGKYIAGFNNIDEKDCGSQSGWLYFVNGNPPSKSCSKYKLSNGDNVVFSYTCK